MKREMNSDPHHLYIFECYSTVVPWPEIQLAAKKTIIQTTCGGNVNLLEFFEIKQVF